MSSKPGAWIVALMGMKHTGKSTLARKMIALSPRPVYILDPKHEYEGQVFSSTDDFFQAAENDQLTGWIYCFRPADPQDARNLFALAGKTGGTLVVEEAYMWCGPSSIDDSLASAIFSAAHAGLNQIYIFQRSAAIHKHIISQADSLISFRQKMKLDIDRLRGRLSDPERLADLETGEFLATDPFPQALAPLQTD